MDPGRGRCEMENEKHIRKWILSRASGTRKAACGRLGLMGVVFPVDSQYTKGRIR